VIACGLLARELERLLAHQLGELRLEREVGALLGREIGRALGKQRHELLSKSTDAVAGPGADRMERQEVSELGRSRHLARDVSRLQAIDLVQGDHHRHSERKDPVGDEPVARADSLPRREHEQYPLDVLEGVIDRALHVLGQGIPGALKARQVCEHELVILAARDAEDATPRRLWLVGDDRNLAAAERVHERRLADVRSAGNGDEPCSHRAKESGNNSAGVDTTSSPLLSL
jgi:hypothetical protein